MDKFGNLWQFMGNDISFAKLDALKRKKDLNNENFVREIRQYVKTHILELGERVEFLEMILGVVAETGEKNNEKKENRLEALNKYVVKFIPEIGFRVELIETILGVEPANNNENKFNALNNYVMKYLPEIGERLEFLERVLGISLIDSPGKNKGVTKTLEERLSHIEKKKNST